MWLFNYDYVNYLNLKKKNIWIFVCLDLYFAGRTWRLKPPSKKLTSYIFHKQTPEQILHIHKDVQASTESTECLPLCVPVLNCWLAELPEDVSGCSSREQRRLSVAFFLPDKWCRRTGCVPGNWFHHSGCAVSLSPMFLLCPPGEISPCAPVSPCYTAPD